MITFLSSDVFLTDAHCLTMKAVGIPARPFFSEGGLF